MNNIIFNKTILHILDSNLQVPIISLKELEIETDVADFLVKHINKVVNDDGLKNVLFQSSNDNMMYNLCEKIKQNTECFIDVSIEVANMLFVIMKENPSIPSGDAIMAIFEDNGIKYFLLMKLNYKNSYMHYVSNTKEGNFNNLIKQKTTLPNETQKIEECVLINLSNYECKIIEKKYEICGDKEYYLSKYFLKSVSELSNLQKLKVLDKAVSKVSKKYFDEEFDKVSKFRTCLAQNIEETSTIEVDSAADFVFGDNQQIKKEYLEEVKKGGLVENVVEIPETNKSNKKYRTQKLKTDSGIEINFPSNIYNNKDIIEFINNSDGTISILIKNINKVTNR